MGTRGRRKGDNDRPRRDTVSIHHLKSIREKNLPDAEIRRCRFVREGIVWARQRVDGKIQNQKSEITSTAVPSSLPARNLFSAVFASSRGKVSIFVFTGTRGAISRNSSPSRRVKFATE